MIYLDPSALLKLLFEESESTALQKWLISHEDLPPISSELAQVEVLRACRRIDHAVLPAARVLLGQLDVVPLARTVVERAGELEDPLLRSLDALHLASALLLGSDLQAFVAYDERLLRAARAEGLETLTPGG